MRQVISTALVAVIVSVFTVTAVGVLAQDEPATTEQAIVPSVLNINANKVDGKHAVGSKASRAKRRGKLVATNRQGYLPSNIIKPAWRLILGMPAGFRDGVDDVGYVSEIQPTTYPIANNGTHYVYADVPVAVDVELYVIPAAGAWLVSLPQFVERGPLTSSLPGLPAVADGMVRRVYIVANQSGATTTYKVRTRVYNSGIALAALKQAAKRVKVGTAKAPKRAVSLGRLGR